MYKTDDHRYEHNEVRRRNDNQYNGGEKCHQKSSRSSIIHERYRQRDSYDSADCLSSISDLNQKGTMQNEVII